MLIDKWEQREKFLNRKFNESKWQELSLNELGYAASSHGAVRMAVYRLNNRFEDFEFKSLKNINGEVEVYARRKYYVPQTQEAAA